MQRWHLTLGLAGLAVFAAALAPRLAASKHVPPIPDTPPTPDVVDVPPVPEPPPVPTTPTGHLTVEAGLDRTAVLVGAENERFLTITVSAPAELGEAFRRTVDVAVVLDTSGSMSARGKIDYAKRAAKLLATSMEPGDVYGLVTFSDDATTIVPAMTVEDPAVIHSAVDRILEGGGTNLYAGIEKGATEVKRTLGEGAVGRVVLLSDGQANVGVTDPDAMARYVGMLASQGVTVSAIGLGLDYNEDLLARLADVGGGTYDFVDDPRELEAVFADELQRSAAVVARDTTVTVKLPDGITPLDVLGWDAVRTTDGWSLRLGDVYAGETRKIVTRVRVAPSAGGEVAVADVQADYHDLVDAVRATSTAHAAATATTDTTLVETSVDKASAVHANRAYGNWYLEQSTRAYEKGDVTKAKQLASQGQGVLQRASGAYAAPELAKDADNAARQQQVYDAYAPESDAGKRSIKAGKEYAREAMH